MATAEEMVLGLDLSSALAGALDDTFQGAFIEVLDVIETRAFLA